MQLAILRAPSGTSSSLAGASPRPLSLPLEHAFRGDFGPTTTAAQIAWAVDDDATVSKLCEKSTTNLPYRAFWLGKSAG